MQSIKTLKILLFSTLAVLGSAFAMAAVEDEIRLRTQPVGEVCLLGEECAASLALASSTGEPRTPETIFQTFCFACHGTGVNNAPMLGNAEHWAPRIEQGMDILYQHAIEGYKEGLMPPKGLCMDCSNEEIQATVDYMVAEAQPQ